MKNDQNTTLAELRIVMTQFVEERHWNRFHTPKNLASSIAIETAELMEHFQWLTGDESAALRDKIPSDAPLAEEMADVLSYLLSLANSLNVDLAAAFLAKMEKNRLKYPIDQAAHFGTQKS